jgi:hypothetical protein
MGILLPDCSADSGTLMPSQEQLEINKISCIASAKQQMEADTATDNIKDY